MSRSELSTDRDETPVERVATRLGSTDLIDVAAAAYAGAGALAVRLCGRDATAVAAVVVASRRSAGGEIGVEAASERAGVDPSTAARAVEQLDGALSPPAPEAEIRSLRRSIVAIDELLAAIDRGRTNPPRLSGAPFRGIDPTVAAMASRSLDELDEEALRDHRRRLAADLELARLGVELYTLVRADDASARDAGSTEDE